MKKYSIVYLSLVILFSISSFSCSKSDSNNTILANFTWSYDGTTYSATLVEAYTNGTGAEPRVIAAVIGTSFFSFERKVDFQLTSFNIGTYQFQSSATNLIRYINDPNLIAGSVNTTINITANSNNLLSGNFSGFISNTPGVNKSISGTFSNVPIVR